MTTLPAVFLTRPIAHRALHDKGAGRAENSIKAIHAAIKAGYGLEIDIQMSKDNQAMVFHDYDLRRLTPESGAIRLRTRDELCNIPLLGGGETIPSLTEVLDIVAGKTPLLIEIKDQDGALGTDVGPLEQAIATLLRPYAGPVAVMSFNPHSVARMQDLLPDTPRGLTTGAFLAENWVGLPRERREFLHDIPDLHRVGASFISHSAVDLNRPLIRDIRAQNIPVLCWTIRDQLAEDAARDYADNITFEGYLPSQMPA